MRSVRVLEVASVEAIEAAAWYEQERPGLGVEFDLAIQAALDLLETEIVPLSAMSGAAGARGVKRLILKRFPFDVVVSERHGEFLVIAFAHHARLPGYWRSRMQE